MDLAAVPIAFWGFGALMVLVALGFLLPGLWRTGGAWRGLAFVLAVAVPIAAFGLHARLGDSAATLRALPAVVAPGTDAGGAGGAVEAAPLATREDLERHLRRHPDDARALVLLGRVEMADDRFAPAASAYERALAASPKVAADPGVWCELADAVGMAQGGSLEGRPAELIERALALDPLHPKALEMAGSAAYGRRDFATAARHWRTLLAQLPDGSGERAELERAIGRAEQRARLSLPEPGPGRR
jgi:cytochrome c-type biogenesis protein CcmH